MLLNKLEQVWDRKKIVFYYFDSFCEIKYFGLAASAAMHHTMYAAAVPGQDFLDYRGIGPGRG